MPHPAVEWQRPEVSGNECCCGGIIDVDGGTKLGKQRIRLSKSDFVHRSQSHERRAEAAEGNQSGLLVGPASIWSGLIFGIVLAVT